MTSMTLLAGLMLSIALWAWLPPDSSALVADRFGAEARGRPRPPGWLPPAVGLAGLLGVAALLVPGSLVLVLPGVAVSTTLTWLWRHSMAERNRRAHADEVVHACQGLAAQLRIGEIPARALMQVAADVPLLAPVAAAQAIGGDVPAALHGIAARPGCQGLASLARSWQLCEITGAPVALAAERVAEGLRADAATERLVSAELAASRASGRLLAGLPVLGVGLGYLAGGNPIDFLLHNQWGRIAAALAVCLVCAGLVWTTRLAMVDRVDEQNRCLPGPGPSGGAVAGSAGSGIAGIQGERCG